MSGTGVAYATDMAAKSGTGIAYATSCLCDIRYCHSVCSYVKAYAYTRSPVLTYRMPTPWPRMLLPGQAEGGGVGSGISLRYGYAMSSTSIAYGAISLRYGDAMSGTDIPHAALHPVLPYHHCHLPTRSQYVLRGTNRAYATRNT
eukprot:3180333-Rhodomonas_salina.2